MTVSGQPFKIPKDVISKLGDGDLPLGVAVLYELFGERPASHPFGTIAAETVQAIGDGNLNAGSFDAVCQYGPQPTRQSKGCLSHAGFI